MASRLDRLFVLLETGSTSSTRKAAAQQLGQVQRLHPHELPLLLSRVHKCLRSSSWETRVAAGEAVQAILSQVPQWAPLPIDIKEEPEAKLNEKSSLNCDDIKISFKTEDNCSTKSIPPLSKEKLTFAKFDIDHLLSADSNFLMASESKEFENPDAMKTNSRVSDPAAQRYLINKRLGLDIAENFGIDTSDIISNEDLTEDDAFQEISFTAAASSSSKVINLTTNLNLYDPYFDEQMSLSSREINLAKRRARKQKSREALDSQSGEPILGGAGNSGSAKKLKMEDSHIPENNGIEPLNMFSVEEGQWPLGGWVDVLLNDLFSPSWEIRHGSATALREVIKLHGSGGGKHCGQPFKEMSSSHNEWMEDIALRLVSILVLDRFGDFISDQVVAPVRETCSQCLGTLISLMDSSSVTSLLHILNVLLDQKYWEVRHGSLLAIKYLLAVRKDLVVLLLPQAFPYVFKSLSDGVDDVCAVASSCLIPVADHMVKILPDESPKVVSILWDSLADLDDLSSACNSIMGLLATLLAYPTARSNLRKLDILMPRLWPFIHHTSSSVRRSALLTLQKLTELDPSVSPMSVGPLQETLKHVFQRALVEHIPDVLNLIPQVWSDLLKSSNLDTLLLSACPLVSTWLCLAMQPPRLPIEPTLLVSKNIKSTKGNSTGEVIQKVYMSSSGEGDPYRIAQTRLILAEMLGSLTPYIVKPLPPGSVGDPPIELFVRILMVHLNSRSALQRCVTSLVISAWPTVSNGLAFSPHNPTVSEKNILMTQVRSQHVQDLSSNNTEKNHSGLKKKLIECLSESVYFDEIALGFTKLQSECRDFLATLKHYKIPLSREFEENSSTSCIPPILTFDQVQSLCGTHIIQLIQKHIKKNKVVDTLLERRKTIFGMWSTTNAEFAAHNRMTLAAIAGAVCSLKSALPEKLNPVVKPLMEAIRKEENELFQRAAADHLCNLMELVLDRNPCPIPKIIQNLTANLCSDNDCTPQIDKETGILSLTNYTSPSDSGSFSTSVGGYSPSNPNNVMAGSNKKLSKSEEQAQLELKKTAIIERRGATFALTKIVRRFGSDLPIKVSRLWELTFGILEQSKTNTKKESLREIIDSLQVLEIISQHFHEDLFIKIEAYIDRICALLGHRVRAVRHMSSRCLSVWAAIMPEKVMPTVATTVLPLLEAADDVTRQGAIEAIWWIVDRLGLELLPYIVLLVVPVLGRMSDQDDSVRMLASLTFATLVRLMPLEGGVPNPKNLPDELAQRKGEQREFLDQLLNPSKIPEYTVCVPINAELRPYQQAGVNWLGFLNKFKLHGILCDDMGLGKTLQSICILGSDHLERSRNFESSKRPDSTPLPSIVICPPTLTGHWVYEVEKFISQTYLNPLHYHGPPIERNKLKPKLNQHNLVVASYDIVRNDIDFFSSIKWNYCILDEGHIIKNGKTKISKAIKQLKANHRLILSGTPIQNNALELWSLFDFLMPGFLGTEKQFSSRFARPISLARDPKSSPKDQEAGALAMESLHRQALPFLLRRLKEDVLQDLPPKITQDYYCELSVIQEQLYEDFSRTRAGQNLRDNFTSVDDPFKHSHIFQALQYLRKVCNHPKLVLTTQHPKYTTVMSTLAQTKSTLNDINHSAKLPALKQLLLDCGIGVSSSSDEVDVVNQHRALIFCQFKIMLDIIENDLFKVHMPSVTFLRLDGSVPAGQRHSLVTRFNNDPSIDVLLLTTQVGGLGLNLTGADTVIFVEHDWNPMRDLQAMDRAHRIGQKKVVNVYRLITRGTLEEKIMGLQKFKLMTANTVISQENTCIETMATDQLLDLFVLEDNKDEKKHKNKEDLGSIVGAYKNVLENMPELWEDKLYEEEYDLSNFIKNLGK